MTLMTDTVDERPTAATLCRIEGETAALYTPDSDDVGRILHVVADYKDDFDSDTREQAGSIVGRCRAGEQPCEHGSEVP